MKRKMAAGAGVSTLEVPTAPTTVLVVDDHPAIRKGLRMLLAESTEFRVVDEAEDAEQGVALAQALRPDLVILDVSLSRGRGSGEDAARQIRSVSPATRVVAYTVHSEPESLYGMARAGVDVFVLKGEPTANLLEGLRLARQGKTRLPEPLPLSGGLPRADLGAHGDNVSALSRREREVFLLLADGRSVKEAAFGMRVSPKTVETYKYRLMRKLDAGSPVDLARIAIRTGMLSA